jgi:hypothetical protein
MRGVLLNRMHYLHRSCTRTLGLGWPFLAIGKKGPEAIAVILSVLDAAQFRYFDLQAIFLVSHEVECDSGQNTQWAILQNGS